MKENKKFLEFLEKLEAEKNPLFHLFLMHIKTAVKVLNNLNLSASEQIRLYKLMLRIGEIFIASLYGIDFNEIREKIKQQTEDEEERLLLEIQYIAKVIREKQKKIKVEITEKERQTLPDLT